ncbi:CU044_2847 family protein [Streptomyces platensis]|uniref:CU044_2847 family protein n=1 Tax=Streptomyces platensis TaxID=58346 RepID=UPI0037977CAD
MQELACMPLEGGGTILFEATSEFDGPVKVGRVAEAIQELPQTLQATLAPVRETARTVLHELRQAGPEEVEVEFGVNLSAKAGAVITGGTGTVHMKVRLKWNNAEPTPRTGEEPQG